MGRFYQAECDPKLMSPLSLAFVGDGVFEIFVRERLVCAMNCPVNSLHKKAVEQVCCGAQAKAGKILEPILTDEETAVFKRGRNAHTNHIPKNASPADYHAATALEALFGYLYLKGDIDRLRYFFRIICEEEDT